MSQALIHAAGPSSPAGQDVAESAAALLGGEKTLKRPIHSALDAHEMLRAGVPSRAASYLVGQVPAVHERRLYEVALGMSERTFQRMKTQTSGRLNAEQSSRAWIFARILARATDVFGSRDEAIQWLDRPAMGLDQRRPLDLITTPAGVELVETFLRRIDSGVYA